MKMLSRLSEHTALALIDYCGRRLPKEKAEWAGAMRSELIQIEGSREKLSWAAGCVIAALKEGRIPMGNTSVSRGVLALEWAICFGFLSFAFILWLGIIIDTASMSTETMPSYFQIRHPVFFVISATELLRSLIGPIGLILAYQQLIGGHALRSRRSVLVLTGLVLAAGIALEVLYSWQAGTVRILAHWREFTLLTVLPVAGLLHIHFLSSKRDTSKPVTTAS